MKQAFLVFRKDVRHLWRELGVYVLLLAVYAVVAPQVWPDKMPNSFLEMFATLLKLLMPADWNEFLKTRVEFQRDHEKSCLIPPIAVVCQRVRIARRQ